MFVLYVHYPLISMSIIVEPVSNPSIYDANIDLGYKDNMLNMLVGILVILCPRVTYVGIMPPLTCISYT